MADPKVTLRIEATDAYSAVLANAENEFKSLADRGSASGDRLSKAFKDLGIKTALDISAEKARLVAAFEAIKKSGVASADEIKRAEKALQDQLQKVDGALDSNKTKANESTSGIATGLRGVATWLAAAFTVDKVLQFTKAAFEASMAVDSITSKLKVMSGSDKAAAGEWEFIRAEAKRLGLDLLATADSYSTFAVATKGTSMEGAKTKQLFSAMAEGMTALHLSADKASAVMYQFQQMMSKGKVNMQDLRVASESFPGLMGMIASSLGITTRELMKQMEAGDLMADDVLPKLAEQLHKTYGSAATEAATKGRAELNKFNTAVFELKAHFGEAVLNSESGFSLFTGIVRGAQTAIYYLQASGIYVDGFVKKMSAFGEAGGVVGLLTGGEDVKNELKAEFDAINAATEHALNLRKSQLDKWSDTSKKTEKDVADAAKTGMVETREEAERNSQRRRDNAKKTGEDLAKINIEYAKQTGGYEAQITADMLKQYEDRKKAVTDFYNQKKAESKNDIEEASYEIIKNQKLQQIEQQHQRDIEVIQAQAKAKRLETLQAEVDLETLFIREKMAKNQITTQEGERQITMLTVAAAKAQYDAKKAVTDKYADIYGKSGEDYSKLLKSQEEAHKAYLSASLSAYKTYADNIKAIDQQIKDFRASIQDKIRDIQQKGMTDAQKYADDQKRYDEAVSASRAALAAKDYDTAMKYAKQAEELAGRLVDKKVEGNTKLEELAKQHQERLKQIEQQGTDTKQTDQQKQASEVVKENAEYEKKRSDAMKEQAAMQQGITTATQALNQVEQLGVQIMQAKKQENVDALEKLKQIQDMKLDPKNLAVNMDNAALESVKSQIAALTATETKTIIIKTVGASGEASFSNTGGATAGYFAGGKVANGSTLRDSVSAVLARDEWVINNKAAGFWGDNLMAAINAPLSASGRKLQEALRATPAPTQPNIPNVGTLNLNVDGFGSLPVQAPMDLLADLNTALRRKKMSRPNP